MATYSNYFTGGVDELRFYKGACTDEEILAQYKLEGAPFDAVPEPIEGMHAEVTIVNGINDNMTHEGVHAEVKVISASWV